MTDPSAAGILEKRRAPDITSGVISLPPDLVARASQRLSAAAFIYAAAYLLAFVPGLLLEPAERQHVTYNVIAFGFILGSALIGWLARKLDLPAQRVLDLGLIYEVIGALGIEIGLLWWTQHLVAPAPGLAEGVLIPGAIPPEATAAAGDSVAAMGTPEVAFGISWTCVWIVIFPLILPATPGKAFLAALAAASVRPLMFLIVAARGDPLPSFGLLFGVTLPNYICVGLAVAAARIVYGWGMEVSKARRMGSYHLVERLGEGGMGEVWRAEHRMLARPAAVKLIRPESMGGSSGERTTLLRRFEREARATARLTSPHTVQLFDFGVSPNGTFYYVMELLRGLDLDVFVQRFGPMPAARAAHVMQQACHSLAEAHARGLIHRDVKPANVYLCRVGIESDFVKLLDFGLVKHVQTEGRADVALTAAHMAAGTPAYMAPEMATGESRIDGRADLYAIGCVGYWLVTGRQVFEDSSPMRLMLAHAHDLPEPPSKKSELPIPPDFEELIMACLAKDPTDRPSDAGALATALDGLAAGWTRGEATRWWRTHLPELAG